MTIGCSKTTSEIQLNPATIDCIRKVGVDRNFTEFEFMPMFSAERFQTYLYRKEFVLYFTEI